MTQQPYASAQRVFWIVDNGSSMLAQSRFRSAGRYPRRSTNGGNFGLDIALRIRQFLVDFRLAIGRGRTLTFLTGLATNLQQKWKDPILPLVALRSTPLDRLVSPGCERSCGRSRKNR
jgi:hypothetical protein